MFIISVRRLFEKIFYLQGFQGFFRDSLKTQINEIIVFEGSSKIDFIYKAFSDFLGNFHEKIKKA
jgi:hypothetical protein